MLSRKPPYRGILHTRLRSRHHGNFPSYSTNNDTTGISRMDTETADHRHCDEHEIRRKKRFLSFFLANPLFSKRIRDCLPMIALICIISYRTLIDMTQQFQIKKISNTLDIKTKSRYFQYSQYGDRDAFCPQKQQTPNHNHNGNIENKGRCAIILHGIPRSFKSIVLPTLTQYIIHPNAKYQCDYYIQHHLRDFDEMPAHPGRGGFVNASDVFEITNTVNNVARDFENYIGYRPPIVQFVNSTDADAFQRHREVYAKMRLLKDSRGNWLYLPEVIRSWDGMKLAWELMDFNRQKHDICYDLVAVLGLDMALLSPIDLFEPGAMGSGCPTAIDIHSVKHSKDFIQFDKFSSSDEFPPSPDQGIARGSYDAMKIWMTGRFHHLDNYLDKLLDENMGVGFAEDRFLQDEILPRLASANATMNFDSSFCALDAMPNDSVSLTKCGNIDNNERILRQILHHHSCDFSSDRIVKKSESLNSNTANAIDTAAICTIVTNEEYYLDEWIDYHLGIGFSHFYLYDNSDEFDLGRGWLDSRPRLHQKVTIHSFPGIGMQMEAFRDCASRHGSEHRWMAHLDADEYLVLRKHSSVVPFLEDYCEPGAVSINWIVQSWGSRLHYSPEPVTKRFPGSVGVDGIVKTITKVDALDLNGIINPHFTLLTENYHQVDTDGNILDNALETAQRARNNRNLTNVASVYHFKTKSWKEFISKRERGRSDLSGEEHDEDRAVKLESARNGELIDANREDTSPWEMLKAVDPKYRFFESFSDDNWSQINLKHDRYGPAICCLAANDEAYIDEWADYHLALGFSTIYIFDSSDQYWMQQWGEERRSKSNSSVIVKHYPGDALDPLFKVSALVECLSTARVENHHEMFLLLDVNDFFISPETDTVAEWRTTTSVVTKVPPTLPKPCVISRIERVVFGTGGRNVFDPLPVTKRFLFRLHSSQASLPPAVMLHIASGSFGNVTLHQLKELLHFQFLPTESLSSDRSNRMLRMMCPKNIDSPSTTSNHFQNAYVHHYLRSKKECIADRGVNSTICHMHGTVEDTFGWEQMQFYLPAYANYNGFV